MDDNFRKNNQPANQPADGQRIDVNVGGGSQTPEPTFPAAPSVPGPEPTPEPAPVPPAEPAPPAPPQPGTVVSSSDGSIGGPQPKPQVVTSGSGHHGKKRWLKVILLLIIIAALAAGGWYAYKKHQDNQNAAKAANQSKDIPLLKIGLYKADYGSLYPDMSLSEYSFIINSQMFEGLVRYEDKSKIVPDLASNWTNPDDSTWVFTLKKGIKFHDGNTMAADDVKYSIDTIMANTDSDIASTFADTIKSVDVVDTNTVKITTKAPDPVLLNKLNFLYIIDANLPKGADPSQAGTGAYEVKAGTKPSTTRVQMTAFKGYHGGQPKTKALDFTSSTSTASLLKGLKTHQYNIVGTNLTTTVPKDLKGIAVPFYVDESNVTFLSFNTVKTGPLQNKLVREAIRYAVNPVAIGKADGTVVTPLSQLVPESIPGYNPAIPVYKQNISKAKQLMAQAGYPNGVTVRYSTPADPKKSAEIAKELKQIGITATIDYHPDLDEFIDYISKGNAEMYDLGYSSDTLDGQDIYATILQTLQGTSYKNPQIDSLLEQAATNTDPSKRLKQLQEVGTIVNQDIPVVPLSTQEDVYLMDKNYAIHQDMPSSLLSAYFYKVYLK